MNTVIRLLTSLIICLSTAALAEDVVKRESQALPCGVLERFDGEIELLDPNRTKFIPAKVNAEVPCGSWISIQDGWGVLRHRQGFQLMLGSNTFLQIFDNLSDAQLTGNDHVILFKGQLYAIAPHGIGELRLITANSRTRMSNAIGIITFNTDEEKTQLTMIQNRGTIENRFHEKKRILVKQGEASDLNFKILRVVPSTPRAVKVASLKEILSEFPLEEKDLRRAIQIATNRKERMFAVDLSGMGQDSKNRSKKSREPANEKDSKYTYAKTRWQKGDREAQKKWLDRLVSGDKKGVKMLFPEEKKEAKRNPAQIKQNKVWTKEQREKQRLLEELSELGLE